MLEVLYNTDYIQKYHKLTTTIIVNDITEEDIKEIIRVMNEYLHHFNCIILRNRYCTNVSEDIIKKIVKAKQDWFKNVYCYKYKIIDNEIVIYIDSLY